MKLRFFVFVILLFLVQSCRTKQAWTLIELPQQSTGLNERIDALVATKMNAYRIPGLAIGVVEAGSLRYVKGYGVSSLEQPRAVSPESIFHTASVSKLFTAQAIVQLAAEGRLSLDDKLVDWAPGLNYRDAAFTNITIRQLLNSTAGLSDVSNYRWGKNQQAETSLTDYVLSQNFRLESEPGTTYSYSNLGYNLLGYVIEQCTSTPFEDHLRSAVLEPAGMEQSDFRAFRIADSLRVAPHSRRGSKGSVYQRSIYPYTREHAASSTLNASATELSSWMLHFFQQLKDQTTAATFRAMISPSFAAYPQIGLGFQLYGFAEGQAIGHFGGDKGFRSLLMMIPEYEHGVVVLANCDYQEDFRQEIVLEIMGWLLVSSSTGIP